MPNKTELHKILKQLSALKETMNNPKILWEEVVLVVKKSQEAQEKALELLEKLEKDTQSLTLITEIYDMREKVWDTLNLIEEKALAVKEKTFTKKEEKK